MADVHKRYILAAYPDGMPKESDWKLETGPVPVPGPGEFLVRTVFLAPEPRLRLMMNPTNDSNRAMRPNGGMTDIGKIMPCTILGEVVQSNDPDYKPGDVVEGFLGWQNYAIATRKGFSAKNNPSGIAKMDLSLGTLSSFVSVLGIPGLTAHLALRHEGKVKPGETVVVTSAAGTVGSVAAQLAKLAGAHVVGLTSTDEKCEHLIQDLGLDVAINYRKEKDLTAAIRKACPKGVDYYFDNVGGEMADVIKAQLNPGGRVTRCGIVAKYNKDTSQWRQSDEFAGQFTIHDHVAEYDGARKELSQLVKAGKLKYAEEIFDGFEKIPRVFIDLLNGKNTGKFLVRCAPDPKGTR